MLSDAFSGSAQSIGQTIITALTEAVILVDKHQVIKLFNPASCHLTGYSDKEVLDQPLADIIKLVDQHGQSLSSKNRIPGKLLRPSKKNRHQQLFLLNKNGQKIPIKFRVRNLTVRHHQTTGQLIVLLDKTEDHARNQAKNDFISTASHEMRTPLATIEGYLALMADRKICQIDNRARNYLQQAKGALKNLSQLFSDLLTASRSQDGQLVNNPRVINAQQAIADLLEKCNFNHDQKGVKLQFEAQSTEKYLIKVDPDRFKELVINLIDNAVKYTDHGQVTIRLQAESDTILLTVVDTGRGISETDLPHIFQQFYRVDNDLVGTGLGLFIAKKIVDLYQGSIWAQSQLGVGSQLFVRLARYQG